MGMRLEYSLDESIEMFNLVSDNIGIRLTISAQDTTNFEGKILVKVV